MTFTIELSINPVCVDENIHKETVIPCYDEAARHRLLNAPLYVPSKDMHLMAKQDKNNVPDGHYIDIRV